MLPLESVADPGPQIRKQMLAAILSTAVVTIYYFVSALHVHCAP
jgi:uncharacterized membrane protein